MVIHMGVSKKTFLYSITLATVMISFVIGYFVFMLPSLYVDYVMKSNLEETVEIQKGYMESGTYENLTVKNPSTVFSLEIPRTGNRIYVEGKFFRLTLTLREEKMLGLLNLIRNGMNGEDSFGESWEEVGDFTWEDFSELWEREIKGKLVGRNIFAEDSPVGIAVEGRGSQGAYQGEYMKVHMPADDLMVYEMGVSNGEYRYTTYFAFGQTREAYVVTILPTMTPQMEEIKPVVMGSLPMIISVICLVVLVFSRFFSGQIVHPIVRLADYAESAKLAEGFETDIFDDWERGDEIGMLGRALHELYGKLRDNYQELERKNLALEEKNVSQEVFLRASSHQLKTPIAAALLLVEGMINEVGKYKNTKEYLPEVKQQLLSMRKLVEDILYLNHHADNLQKEGVAVGRLAEELVKDYAVQIEARGLQVTITGDGVVVTDREMLKKITDNLISNAVQYTPEGERIEIVAEGKGLCIKNYGVVIEEELLPNIFEPFVSSDGSGKTRGLGLYVASYYSRELGCRLEVKNVERGVQAEWRFDG